MKENRYCSFRYARKREKLAIMSVLPDPGSKHAEAAA